VLGWVAARELAVVRGIVAHSRRPAVEAATVVLIHLGNGWAYLLMGLLLLAVKRGQAWPCILTSIASVALAFPVYVWLKRRLARVRPCDRDPALAFRLKPLDVYSCPSGHCMTVAAVGISLGFALPNTSMVMLLLWSLIAWSRLSSAHHYPSDLALGTGIGAGTASAVYLVFS
jgi:undecaprenyl-diphosphatase